MISKATAMVFTSEGKPFEKQEVILNNINSNEVLRIVYTTICITAFISLQEDDPVLLLVLLLVLVYMDMRVLQKLRV